MAEEAGDLRVSCDLRGLPHNRSFSLPEVYSVHWFWSSAVSSEPASEVYRFREVEKDPLRRKKSWPTRSKGYFQVQVS